ncbi:DUF2293 domain-containing protein [Streptomyces antimicrobicus]|uniref:DUF2293 domain-containing protein n=1 Tax=Streptomyces antimicrobicus TaxID=2883108 RepID=A0ABS8BF34_9ACTN|nr:DUF2293 domain-containing protein [Streptomyces antimicrobicus]MCB5183144.1 DUF2293 domain-containing protein [Streptomyces antimicrobicus]
MNLVVFEPLKGISCAECRKGPLPHLVRVSGVPRCLDCSALGHLVYLPRGDAALTRRARTGSSVSAVVVRFNKRRRRYERQGLLVEREALARAEQACRADAAVRARGRDRARRRRAAEDTRFTAAFAAEILRLFPGCPPDRATAIAAHASLRGSGRVGRTAAGRALDPAAVAVAVRAAVRHLDTEYDALLAARVPRFEARARLAARIDAVLDTWRTPPPEKETPSAA